MTAVHLIRHGEVANPDRILYGRRPGFDLSPAGVRMAEAVAEAVSAWDVGVVLSSPLARARQTAQPIADRFGLPVLVDERLLEASNRLEGMAVSPGLAALRNPRIWWHLRNPFRPSWGEPYRQIAARMLAAVAAAREAAGGGEAICVSHQAPIWILRRWVEGRWLWHLPTRRRCQLASITSFSYGGGGPARPAVSYRCLELPLAGSAPALRSEP